MICWYKDKKMGIFFDKIPQIGVRYYIPSMSNEEKKSIEKYPFICKSNLLVELKDYKKNKSYQFEIPKGYCYDGASIPRLFWRIIGSNTDNRFLIAALIHDVLCENHEFVDNDKNFSSEIFNALLSTSGVKPFKRFWMKHSVNIFQTFCKWSK